MFIVDTACKSDVDDLVSIQQSAFLADVSICGSGPPGYDSIEYQLRLLEQDHYFVVKRDEVVVGGFYFDIVDDYIIHLIRLFVSPEFQRIGVGKCSIEYLKRYSKNIREIVLETPSFSHLAHRFYEGCGFVKQKEIQYQNGTSYQYKLSLDC